MGSQSKLGADFPVKAYKLSENRYTLEDIKASIPSCKVDLAPLYEKPRRKSTVTLEEAKELYPEWYEKRIVQGEPKQKSKKQGGTWVCNEALYEWWKRKITEEVHLARARAVQDVDYPNHEWAGRPNAEQTVREWQESHPAGKKADCIRETGLSRPTVYKWWKSMENCAIIKKYFGNREEYV